MKQEEIKESLDKVGDALEDVKDAEKKEKWLSYVLVSTAIVAVIAAIVGLFESQMTAKTILAKNDAIFYQNQATNMWNYYQAKSIKGHLYGLTLKTYPAQSQELKKMIDKYETEQVEIKAKAEELERKTQRKNEESAHYYKKHHILTFSVTFMQIAIAISSISALTRSKKFWILSLIMGTAGFLVSLYGIFF